MLLGSSTLSLQITQEKMLGQFCCSSNRKHYQWICHSFLELLMSYIYQHFWDSCIWELLCRCVGVEGGCTYPYGPFWYILATITLSVFRVRSKEWPWTLITLCIFFFSVQSSQNNEICFNPSIFIYLFIFSGYVFHVLRHLTRRWVRRQKSLYESPCVWHVLKDPKWNSPYLYCLSRVVPVSYCQAPSKSRSWLS